MARHHGRLCLLVAAIVALSCLSARGYTSYHIGLDFVTAETDLGERFLTDMLPYQMTDPGNEMVMEGAFAGRTEDEVQRAIVLAVEDAFRGIDAGTGQTVAIAIHPQLLDAGGAPNVRKLNVAVGESTWPGFTLYGEALLGAANLGIIGNGEYAAAVYPDEIDTLPVVYDTFEGAVNSIAGTTAHEIGHLFETVHQDAGPGPVYPIMSSGIEGLPNEARLTERIFFPTAAGTILANAVTVNRTDFNMDGSLDAADVGSIVSNWARDDALMQEGDANNDHLVDGEDVGILLEAWSADPGPASAGSVVAEYDTTTGEIIVSVDGVLNWFIEAADGAAIMTGDPVANLPGSAGGLVTDNDFRVGESNFGGVFGYTDLDLGAVAMPGLAQGDLVARWQTGFGSPEQSVEVIVVPEPTGIVLLGLGAWIVAGRRRDSQFCGRRYIGEVAGRLRKASRTR